MIPLAPNSGLTRSANFVKEEWSTYFDNGRADSISTGGWKGIVYASLTFVDPKTSWNFFSQTNFDPNWIDGGASRSWYLAQAACLGGVS
jgi:endo-1,3(4)-beta-glucanase